MDDFNELMKKAISNDPMAIFEIAQRFNSGEIPSNGDTYIRWLKKFLNHDTIQAIINDLEDEEHSYDMPCDPYTRLLLLDKIEEAGICLGLYYYLSSEIDELNYAQQCFYYAWIASRFDYIEIKEDESKTDILALMSGLDRRIKEMGGRTDD